MVSILCSVITKMPMAGRKLGDHMSTQERWKERWKEVSEAQWRQTSAVRRHLECRRVCVCVSLVYTKGWLKFYTQCRKKR